MGFMDDMVCGLYKHLCDDELSTNRNFGLRKIILLRLGSNFNVTYVQKYVWRDMLNSFVISIIHQYLRGQIGLSSFDNMVKMHLAG